LISDIGLIVAALGAIGVMFGLRQSYRERIRQFESMYVKRYWDIYDHLSLKAIRGSSTARIGRGDEKAIRNYILLCEDELQMRRSGYISDSTYYVWADGMRLQLSQSMFKDIWSRVRDEAKANEAFAYKHLVTLLAATDSEAGDPLSTQPFMRRVRGLRGWRGI
jgi:hypothetical protein